MCLPQTTTPRIFEGHVCSGVEWKRLCGFFFASFRRRVGRKPLNSVGRDDSQGPRMEQLMHFAVRSFQLKFWFSGSDMFVLYGKLRELARTDASAVNWEALNDFKLAFDVACRKFRLLYRFAWMRIPMKALEAVPKASCLTRIESSKPRKNEVWAKRFFWKL